MHTNRVTRFAVIALLTVVALGGLSACSESAPTSTVAEGLTGGVAATVDGTEIMEDDITTYIQSFRTSSEFNDEDSWGTYLASIGLDAPGIREQVIDFYITKELVRVEAEKQGITVTEDELNEQINKMRANFESDEAWNEALIQAGTTEEMYRENVQESMLESRLQEKLAESTEPLSDEELLSYVQMYAEYFNGAKRSSHILFTEDDEETAKKVLEQLKNGEVDFAEAAKEYSQDPGSAAEGGDIGWDMLTTMQGSSLVTEYTDALAELEKDGMSDLVKSQFGYHIIKCTDIYTMPEEGVQSLGDAPEELVEYLRSMMESSKQSSALSEWVEKAREEADVVINDMPENVPYNVDVSKYAVEEDAESSESSDLEVEVEESEESSGDEDSSSSEEVIVEDDGSSSSMGDEASSSSSEDMTEEDSSQPAEISSEAEKRAE